MAKSKKKSRSSGAAKRKTVARQPKARPSRPGARRPRGKPTPITLDAHAKLDVLHGGKGMSEEEAAQFIQGELSHSSLDVEMVRHLKRTMRKGGIAGIQAIKALREMQRDVAPERDQTVEVTLQVG